MGISPPATAISHLASPDININTQLVYTTHSSQVVSAFASYAITEAYRFLELKFNLQSNGSPRLDLEAARATTAFVLFRFLDCGHRDTLCFQSSVRVSYCPAFTRSPPPAVVTGHCSHPGHRGRGTRNLKWTGSCTIVN